MKALSSFLRTTLLALTLVCTATTGLAYDFMVNGIYYNQNGDKATVTYQGRTLEGYNNGVARYSYHSDYMGKVVIPESVSFDGNNYSVTAIGDHAFHSCNELISVSLPQTIEEINEYAFCDCSSLRGVTCFATIPPTWNGNQSYGIDYNKTTLYVPLDLVNVYETSYIWDWFSNIIGFGQNTFSMSAHINWYGDTVVIPVTMENVDEITAFQTDIYLPEGFELLTKNGEYMVELSDRKGRDHVIMASDAPDGAIRVLSYSPTLKTYSGIEGELFYFTIKVPADGSGIVTYPIWLRKTLLTTIEEDEVGALETLGNVNVYFYILGDVDHSGYIDVADIVLTAKYILNQNPEPFIFDAADINGDNKITITDVVKIAHLVLDADYDEPTKKMNAPSDGDNIVCGDFDHNSHMVAICLNNDQGYTAFQLDLTFPMGMTASEFALTERANSLGLIVKNRGNGKVRVLGYSPDLKTITGNNGTLLSFHVDRESEILVDNIQLVTPEGFSVCPNGFVIAMDNTTKVNEQAVAKVVDHINYYNLAGQRIDCPESGVTLTVTTYADGTRTTSKVIK